MTIPTTFAAATSATGAQLDTNFQFVGAYSVQPCTVTGTNALTITLSANTVALTSYAQGLVFSAVATGSNTGATTAQLGSLTALNVYRDSTSGPVALTGGEIVIGNYILLIYDAALNSGAGGFHLISTPPTAAQVLNQVSTTQGAIAYRGASGWVALNPGIAGQVLETGGASANPAWANFSAGATAGATSSISVTASPFTYTAGSQYETVYISGGTVSNVAVASTTVFAATGCTVRLAPGKSVVVTYSVAPTMAKTVD